MTTAFIMFPPSYLQRDAWLSTSKGQLIAAYQDNLYSTGTTIQVSDKLEGEAIADELYDLTNNPGRQDEREERYGRSGSLSVGDIVKVGQDVWLCQSIGWSRVCRCLKQFDLCSCCTHTTRDITKNFTVSLMAFFSELQAEVFIHAGFKAYFDSGSRQRR